MTCVIHVVDFTQGNSNIMCASCSGSFRSKNDQGKKPEETITPAPSMRKSSTFSDEKPESSTKPSPVRQPTVTERHTKADEWERAEFQEIRQRYLDFECYITLNFYQRSSSQSEFQ